MSNKIQRLDPPSFARARTFLTTQARPLEAARFRLHFEQGSVDDVITQLSPYQNADGGFGHGLEPDLRTPRSSALATTVAFQTLREAGVDARHPLVESGVRYLLDTYNADEQIWPIAPQTDDGSPHAPWWEPSTLADSFGRFRFNPAAEALAVLYDYPQLTPSELRTSLSAEILVRMQEPDAFEMHDFLCCRRLVECSNLPAALRDDMIAHLRRLLPTLVVTDPAQWQGYGLRPLQAAPDPASPFLSGLEEAVDANLDHLIQTQHEDGSWLPVWSWGDAYPEQWGQAKQEWQGVLTLEALLSLKRYARIDT